MSRSIVFALVAFGFLSACSGSKITPPAAPIFGGAHSQSVGFSGVGHEPG